MGVGVNKKVFLCLSWAKNWAKAEPELTGLKMALPPSFYLIPRVATRGMSSYRLAIADSHMQLDRGRVRVLGAGCCAVIGQAPPGL
jgi:hypothetical protein